MRFAAGDTIGRYHVSSVIGSGAMGEVYRALDPVMEREVAIKVLSNPTLEQEALSRFAKEARVVAALSHPNVVTIHDVGTVDGVPYAVMEYLVGETLRARLADGPLGLDDAVAYARQMAMALAAVHERQIVHRDLKPENVFVQRNGNVKLLDFGIAKALPKADALKMTATQGFVIGTFGYMAPEQVRGQPSDERTDMFSFGAVLYEMLTGKRAFPGDNVLAVLWSMRDEAGPPFGPSVGVPAWLIAVVRQCLQREPALRFQSAPALLAVLEHPPADRGTGIARLDATAPEPQSIAVLPFADMSRERDQAYLCEGMAEEIITALGRIPGLQVASRTAAFRFTGTGVDVRAAGEALRVAYMLEGSVRTAASRLRVTARLTTVADGYLVWSRQFDRDLADILAVQEELARTIVDTVHPTFDASASDLLGPSTTAVTEAYTAYLKGRYHWNRRTEEGLVAAIECFSKAIAADSKYGKALAGIADAKATLALYGLRAPHDVMPEAKRMAQRALAASSNLADGYVSLAFIEALYDWDWEGAERHFRKAIEIDPMYATAFQWYALNCLVPFGRFDDARTMIARALALDPTSLPVITSTALVSYFSGDVVDAAVAFGDALRLDNSFAPGHFFLAQALAEQGQWPEAMRHAEQAVVLSGRSAETLAGLGYVAAVSGERERAAAVLEDLRSLARTHYVSPGLVAQVHAGLGNEDEALASLHAACEHHSSDLAWCAVRPAFGLLRGHSGFAAITGRVGLPHTSPP